MKVANIGGARAAVMTYRGMEYPMLFNGYSLFALQSEIGKDYREQISEDDLQGWESLLKAATILAQQGELARRRLGLEEKAMPESSTWGAPPELQLFDVYALRMGCFDAFSVGFGRELQQEDEEVDLGLLELEKKSPS